MQKELRMYFYLLGRGVVSEREMREVLGEDNEGLKNVAASLRSAGVPLSKQESGYWLEDDDVFSFLLTHQEQENLKDFQKQLRQMHPQVRRSLSEVFLLRLAADDLLRANGARYTQLSPDQLEERLELAREGRDPVILRYIHEKGEDVKEVRVENILRGENTSVAMLRDKSAQTLRIPLEKILEVFWPGERKTLVEAEISAQTLGHLAPMLEESRISPRGKRIILSTRTTHPCELIGLIRQVEPQASVLRGGNEC